MRLHVTTALIAGLAVLVSCSDNSKQEAAQTTEQKPVPKTVSDNGATMEIAPEFKAGSEAKIPFTAPEGSNNYWIGFVNPGAAPTAAGSPRPPPPSAHSSPPPRSPPPASP